NKVDRIGLGNLGHLAAGSHTFELQLGDAGWNSIFEIYSRLPRRQIAPDPTAFGPLQTTSREYKCDPDRMQDAIVPLCATVNTDVLNFPPRQPLMTELWARVYMPADLNSPPYPLLVF